MTIFELIGENIFNLLDDAFKDDAEYTEADEAIFQMEKKNKKLKKQVSGDSTIGQYVAMLNQRSARMAEIAYVKGMMDVIDFMHTGR